MSRKTGLFVNFADQAVIDAAGHVLAVGAAIGDEDNEHGLPSSTAPTGTLAQSTS